MSGGGLRIIGAWEGDGHFIYFMYLFFFFFFNNPFFFFFFFLPRILVMVCYDFKVIYLPAVTSSFS